jgi:hypothetical protein
MSWLTEALGGPVLAWELKRGGRRKLWKLLPITYSAWLTFQALTMLAALQSASKSLPNQEESPRLRSIALYVQQLNFFENYFALLLQYQLVLVIAILPVLVASCLGQEKERGTLFALFGTELTSRQILLGKLIGRLVLILPLVLISLPLLVFTGTLSSRGLVVLLLALTQEALIALTVGAICLLFGIWVRRATDAVIACYLFLGLASVTLRAFTRLLPVAFWFDPIESLSHLLNQEAYFTFAIHLAAWALLGGLSLRLGWRRLRKVCVEQRDHKPSRRLWAYRPAVGNHPIRWRECYVIGLAPMPILRIVPRWLALLSAFTFSIAVAVLVANNIAPGFAVALLNIDFAAAHRILWIQKHVIIDSVWFMGVVFIVMADALLLVRCGTSVAEEKRRNTWEDLLLTAQSFREITTGKMWGILQAIVPYVIAYALPVFCLAAVGGPVALLIAGMWIAVPCGAVLSAALMGIDMLKVPPDMDETREGGAFAFESDRAERLRQLLRQ